MAWKWLYLFIFNFQIPWSNRINDQSCQINKVFYKLITVVLAWVNSTWINWRNSSHYHCSFTIESCIQWRTHARICDIVIARNTSSTVIAWIRITWVRSISSRCHGRKHNGSLTVQARILWRTYACISEIVASTYTGSAVIAWIGMTWICRGCCCCSRCCCGYEIFTVSTF